MAHHGGNGRRLKVAHHRWLRRILHVFWSDRMPNTVVREKTGQELACIIGRRSLMWLDHVARMNDNRRAKQVINWVLWERGKGEDQGRTGWRPSKKT